MINLGLVRVKETRRIRRDAIIRDFWFEFANGDTGILLQDSETIFTIATK